MYNEKQGKKITLQTIHELHNDWSLPEDDVTFLDVWHIENIWKTMEKKIVMIDIILKRLDKVIKNGREEKCNR